MKILSNPLFFLFVCILWGIFLVLFMICDSKADVTIPPKLYRYSIITVAWDAPADSTIEQYNAFWCNGKKKVKYIFYSWHQNGNKCHTNCWLNKLPLGPGYIYLTAENKHGESKPSQSFYYEIVEINTEE